MTYFFTVSESPITVRERLGLVMATVLRVSLGLVEFRRSG